MDKFTNTAGNYNKCDLEIDVISRQKVTRDIHGLAIKRNLDVMILYHYNYTKQMKNTPSIPAYGIFQEPTKHELQEGKHFQSVYFTDVT